MNLFFLDIDPKKCAEYHCDKHVVKMILEIVQMLYTAHYILKSSLPSDAYLPVSINHPTAVWIRSSIENYSFACNLGRCLAKEYTHRYHKIHSCEKHIDWLIINFPNFSNFKKHFNEKTVLSSNKYINLINIPLSMPIDSMVKDTEYGYNTIHSYRKYYLLHKKTFAKWTNRPVPDWFSYIKRF